jgi:hypothetical protein
MPPVFGKEMRRQVQCTEALFVLRVFPGKRGLVVMSASLSGTPFFVPLPALNGRLDGVRTRARGALFF